MNKNEKFVIAINREVGSGGHVVGEKLAERLVQAGYGNVSEYKDNEFAIVAFCNQTVRDICTKKDVEIKQAQIDVLNKLKGKYGFYTCCSWGHETKLLGEIIDKFIEEIQNEN